MYEQGGFEPVARIVQLSEVLEKQRIDNAVTHVWQYVPSGIVTQDVLDNVEKAKQPLVKIYHYHNNHLGTPQELTNQDGDVIWLSYDRAWGGSFETIYKQQFIDNFAIIENELQPIKFQGQSLDTETGLHYNRFRYYDSDVGMFISRDPIELLGGSNVFQYAPNPIKFIDPLGLAQTPLNKTGFTVYGLFRPGEDTPYYIGHTEQSLADRLSGHRNKQYKSQGDLTRADEFTEIRSLKGAEGSLTYSQSKGYEQAFREKYDTKTFPGNIIEPIDKSRTDPRGKSHMDNYIKASKEIGIQPTDARGCHV